MFAEGVKSKPAAKGGDKFKAAKAAAKPPKKEREKWACIVSMAARRERQRDGRTGNTPDRKTTTKTTEQNPFLNGCVAVKNSLLRKKNRLPNKINFIHEPIYFIHKPISNE